MWVVFLLLAVAIVVAGLSRGKGSTAAAPNVGEEERELRGLPDETVRLFAYVDDPTPGMRAEYVRRHGEWPGYTAEDFANQAEEARRFKGMTAQLRERYEQNSEGKWVPKENASPLEVREERPSRPQGSTLRRLPHEVVGLFPFLEDPTEEEKAEYVRRHGSWPAHLATDPDAARKAQERVMDLKRRSAEPDFPYVVSADRTLVLREDAPAYRDEGPPGFRPAG